MNWQQDPNGNWLARFVFPEKTDEFSITVDLLADMAVVNPFDFFVEPFAEQLPFVYPTEFSEELAPFLDAEPAGPRLDGVSRRRSRATAATPSTSWSSSISACSARSAISSAWSSACTRPRRRWRPAPAPAATARWLLVQILRHLGLAARFVSGYLIQLRPDVTALDGPVGATQDFTDLHAWAEVYIPGAGWIGLDATSGLLCGRGPSPARGDAAFPCRRADQRRRRAGARSSSRSR